MPSKTPKQAKFMAAVANNPKFAKKVGVPQKVGKEFEMKDKKKPVKKLAFGGIGGALAASAPARTPFDGTGGGVPSRVSGPAPSNNSPRFAAASRSAQQHAPMVRAENQAQQMRQALSSLGNLGRSRGQQVDPGFAIDRNMPAQAFANFQAQENMGRSAPALNKLAGYAKGGKVKQADGVAKKGKTATKMVKMAKGGSVSARADGVAKKGKTHTKMVKMAKGGKMKGCM